MKDLISSALCYQNEKLRVLNQQKLPAVIEWIDCRSPQHMREIIIALQVRGAPLIGVAAALALALFAEKTNDQDEIYAAAALLKSSRPTAVNLMFCIDKQIDAFNKTQNPQSIVDIAEQLFEEDKSLCQKIAAHGQAILNDHDNVLTHCNTGSLVTTGIGTALGVVTEFHASGRQIHVYVDETRPLLQGARLTAWELHQADIPYTVICDNMAASLMQAGKIQKIIVGADRIARNGDFANKIGTYNLAILAKHHHIPFYVAAPYTTIDFACLSKHHIIIEERSADEVRGASGHFGQVIWSVPNSPVHNPAFDITPGDLVTGFIFDSGILQARDIVNLRT